MLRTKNFEKRIKYLFNRAESKKMSVEQIAKESNNYPVTRTEDFIIIGIDEGEVYIPHTQNKNQLLPVSDNFVFWVTSKFVCSYRTKSTAISGIIPERPNYKITGKLV